MSTINITSEEEKQQQSFYWLEPSAKVHDCGCGVANAVAIDDCPFVHGIIRPGIQHTIEDE
jgi:hypothetical protein